MDILSTNSMQMMEKSLDFLWTKQEVILNNITNVETPDFKPQYVTFEESLKNAIEQRADEDGAVSNAQSAIGSAEIKVHTAEVSTRLDDNGVNITEQNIELARNAIQLQYLMDSISNDFSILRTAIKG